MKSLNGVAVAALITAVTAPAAFAQEAVQWRVEDGGNGHWYQRWQRSSESWDQLRAIALAIGGDLASIESASENLVVRDIAFPASGPGGRAAFGGLNPGGVCGGQWQWVDGTDWAFTAWDSSQPDCAGEEITVIYSNAVWHDYPRTGLEGEWTGVIIEYSADCNGDDIVDYGQILDGTYADANGNGVPDCCDEGVSCDPCLGDVNNDGQVNGADISVLLGFWGLNGKPVAADINKDGSVDGADLAQLLGSWGECP